MINSMITQTRKAKTNVNSRSFKMTDIAYGSGNLLTMSDIRELTKFNSLILSPYIYSNAIDDGVIQKVKEINPSIKLFVYKTLTESNDSQDGQSPLTTNNIARHGNARGHSMGSIVSHPDWFITNANTGDRVYNNVFSNPPDEHLYLLDFTNTDVADYMIEAVQTDYIDNGWAIRPDGIYVDICFALPSPRDYTGPFNKDINTDEDWRNAMNVFVKRISDGFQSMGLECQFNRGYTREAEGEIAWQDLEALLFNHPVMEELAFATFNGSWDVQIYDIQRVEQQIDTISNSLSPVVMVSGALSNDYDSIINANRSGIRSTRDVLKYCYGCFLISYKQGDEFCFKLNDYGYPPVVDKEDELSYIDIGLPVSSHRKINGIFYREFEKGFVYVNHTDNDVKIYFNKVLNLYSFADKKVKNDELPAVNSIIAKPCTAYFLFKAET